jgi:hypothetical protein
MAGVVVLEYYVSAPSACMTPEVVFTEEENYEGDWESL